MVENPTTSDADETKGKYSSDDPLTFSNLLSKQTDADRDPLKFQKDTSPDHPEIAEANEQRQREDSASQSTSSRTNNEEQFDQQQKQLAEQILRQDLRGCGPSIEYGSSTTSHSHPRWYSLRRTSYNGCEYYYLICERYASTLEAEAVIIDLGTEITFTPLIPTRQILHDAVEQQRREDFRDGRKPVHRLRSEQLDALEEGYRDLVEIRLFETREGAEGRHRESVPIDVYHELVVTNKSSRRVWDEVLIPTLLPRQRDVVAQSFVDALASKTDTPLWVWQQAVTTALPIMARIDLE